jgi:Phage integrase, N-terminal SAM-like domain
MIVDEAGERDLVALVVAKVGSVRETGEVWEPYRLCDQTGATVAAVAAFLNELQASGRSAATQRSYAMDLLRWFRFLWAVEVPWAQATRMEPVTSAGGWCCVTNRHRAGGPRPSEREPAGCGIR